MSSSITTVEVSTTDALEHWLQLWPRSDMPGSHLSYAWTRACAEVAEQTGSRVIYLVVSDAGSTIGATAISIADKRAHFAIAPFGNYAGMLRSPGMGQETLQAVLDHVSRQHDVETFEHLKVPSHCTLREDALSATMSDQPPVSTVVNLSPEISLGGAKPLVHVGGKWRRNQRSRERQLGAVGDLAFEEIRDPERIADLMPELRTVYEQRWTETSLTNPWYTGSKAQVVDRALTYWTDTDQGRPVLYRLTLDGVTAAFAFNLVLDASQNVLTSDVIAHRPELDRYAPGSILLQKLLQLQVDRGSPFYDFGLGTLPYKEVWANRYRPVIDYRYGSKRRRRSTKAASWVSARRSPELRRIKQEGLRAGSASPPPGAPQPVPATAPATADWQALSYSDALALLPAELLKVFCDRAHSNQVAVANFDGEAAYLAFLPESEGDDGTAADFGDAEVFAIGRR